MGYMYLNCDCELHLSVAAPSVGGEWTARSGGWWQKFEACILHVIHSKILGFKIRPDLAKFNGREVLQKRQHGLPDQTALSL